MGKSFQASIVLHYRTKTINMLKLIYDFNLVMLKENCELKRTRMISCEY